MSNPTTKENDKRSSSRRPKGTIERILWRYAAFHDDPSTIHQALEPHALESPEEFPKRLILFCNENLLSRQLRGKLRRDGKQITEHKRAKRTQRIFLLAFARDPLLLLVLLIHLSFRASESFELDKIFKSDEYLARCWRPINVDFSVESKLNTIATNLGVISSRRYLEWTNRLLSPMTPADFDQSPLTFKETALAYLSIFGQCIRMNHIQLYDFAMTLNGPFQLTTAVTIRIPTSNDDAIISIDIVNPDEVAKSLSLSIVRETTPRPDSEDPDYILCGASLEAIAANFGDPVNEAIKESVLQKWESVRKGITETDCVRLKRWRDHRKGSVLQLRVNKEKAIAIVNKICVARVSP